MVLSNFNLLEFAEFDTCTSTTIKLKGAFR